MNILIGISGGIAAYKIPMLIRLFKQKGHKVKVTVTANALEFVTRMTLQTLSGENVYMDMFSVYNEKSTEHISLVDWADVYIVAPATANIIAKAANGIADDCVSTTLLAFNKQIFFCPAMNKNMYYNAFVQKNIKALEESGVIIIDSEAGFLACGAQGKGRMAEVEDIAARIEDYFSKHCKDFRSQENNQIEEKINQIDCDNNQSDCGDSQFDYSNNKFLEQDFLSKRVLITAGPTREKIDAVRFISNNSSGKMGYALAKEFCQRGARVHMISGPVGKDVVFEDANLQITKVDSAQQMYLQANDLCEQADIIVCSAAVADYTPVEEIATKIKKKQQEMVLHLKPTQDILLSLGKKKQKNQILVGFALETDNEITNAKTKLQKKNLDLIVLNSLNDKGAGFEVDTNKVTLIDRRGNMNSLPLKSKKEVAKDIVDAIKNFV